jgi:hypothetical protein
LQRGASPAREPGALEALRIPVLRAVPCHAGFRSTEIIIGWLNKTEVRAKVQDWGIA